jgi:FAD:protein FMN transferase
MNTFRAMGCEIVLPDGSPAARVAAVRRLFEARDRRFSRFIPASELNRVNAVARGVTLCSEELASMLSLSLDAARATGGLVTPAVGGAVLAAGYDRDYPSISPDGGPVEPAAVPSLAALSLRGRILLRVEPITLDLNGVVKGRTVDDALALLGAGWISAGGDLATTSPLVVGLPGGAAVTLERGGLATSSVSKRSWVRGGERQHHLIDPRTGAPLRNRWRDVTVAAPSCLDADVAAKAALLLGDDGPDWLDERNLAGRFVAHGGAIVANRTWLSSVPLAAAA